MAELRGDLASAEARLKDALTIEEKAGDSATRIAPVSARLGRFYLDHGRLAGAEREFKTAIKRLNAEHDRAHTFGADHADDSYFSLESIVGLGEIAAARGDVSGADRYFKQAVRRYPAPATLGRIADFYEAHGKTPQAEDARNRMTKVVTDQPRYRRDLARYWADRGQRLDEALAWVEAEAVLRRDVHTLDALAWVLSQSKRPAEAARAIEPVLPWAAGDAGVLSRAARILRAAGKPDEAAKLAEQARKANPSVN
jgi:tetratricopeptide (TPR) repeat protein